MDLEQALLHVEQFQLRLLAQRTANFVDVSMEMIMGFGDNSKRRHGNGGGACSIVDQMGIKSGQCHKD
jgi:hypothetical protein